MSIHWEPDEQTSRVPARSYQDAIDVALRDALRAFNGYSKDVALPGSCTKETGSDPVDSSQGTLLHSVQTCEAVDADVSPPPKTSFEPLLGGENSFLSQRSMGSLRFDPAVPQDMPQVVDKGMKPPYRYATLIGMAILQANSHCLTLAQIYQWFMDNFLFYRLTESDWRNSIRHRLSLNRNFVKTQRPSNDPGKGHYWKIQPGQEHLFIAGSYKGPSTIATEGLQFTSGSDQYTSSQQKGRLTTPNSEQPDLHDTTQSFCVDTMSRRGPDKRVYGCNYTIPENLAITHVSLPHLTRERGGGKAMFEASSPEWGVAGPGRSRTGKSTSRKRNRSAQIDASFLSVQGRNSNSRSTSADIKVSDERCLSAAASTSPLRKHRESVRALLGSPGRPSLLKSDGDVARCERACPFGDFSDS